MNPVADKVAESHQVFPGEIIIGILLFGMVVAGAFWVAVKLKEWINGQ